MEVDEPSAHSKQDLFLTNFKTRILDAKPNKVAIFTHAFPDPDAIGSIMALEWLFQKFGIESQGFFDGEISHPQNMVMTNLLDPNMCHVQEFKKDEFDMCVVVDTIPINAGLPLVKDEKDEKKEKKMEITFQLVIDHHRDLPNGGFNGVCVNLKAGSCCGTIYHIIEKLGLKFEYDNDNDSRVATAIMVGISTDTENLMSDDATKFEFDAWAALFEYRDVEALKKIVHFPKPKFWIEHKAAAVEAATVDGGLGVVGLGIIPAVHRDMIADMADEMITWQDCQTAIAFAIVEGDRIEGCVRSRNASVMVPLLCKELGGKHGNGGGKLGKGAYKYNLGGAGFDDDEDDETKNRLWSVFNEKEIKRVIRCVTKVPQERSKKERANVL